jgi:hypothetical protein
LLAADETDPALPAHNENDPIASITAVAACYAATATATATAEGSVTTIAASACTDCLTTGTAACHKWFPQHYSTGGSSRTTSQTATGIIWH